MNADEPHPDEASILTHLLACEEALAAGTPPQQAAGDETPVELQPRLEGDLACIRMLRQVLPRRMTGETPATPISESPAPLLVETPVPPTTDSETPIPPSGGTGTSPSADLPFQELGRFQLRRLLGQGAFGMVFLAADPKLGRAVALKVPRPEALLTGNLRERFVREARAAAGLDHPNVVPVYEAGAVGPLCYIASAYCPGITLADWIKERSELAPERLTAALVATLADAVSHAHGRGVIHRDLKPSNVLLQSKRRDSTDPNSTVQDPSARDSSGAERDFVLRITDFGLAKLTADAQIPTGEAGGAETRSGAVLGTPNYMAPEQASGKNKEVGPAADIYALGAILYELLTGRPPFRGDSLLDTLEQVRSRDPLPPGRLRPKVARDLETICLKCLQKEPHKRYDSAAALAGDLRRYLAGEPIQARPISAWERGLKWARRKPAQAMFLAAALALVAVVFVYSAALARSNNQLEKANENLEKANEGLGKALVAKDEALDAKDKALTEEEKQRRRAKAGEWKARLFSYVSDMNLAQQDWASARVERMRELLNRQNPEPGARELRGFEWHYWDRLANHSARQTLNGHTGEVWCVACSPDGKLLASGGKDGTVRLWDAATGRKREVLTNFQRPVTAVAFAEEGKTLAAVSRRTVRLFDVTGRKLSQTLPRRSADVWSAAAAGGRLALGLHDGSVEIWDVGGKALRFTLRERKGIFWAVAFSADGSMLAAGDRNGIVSVWDAATGKRLALCTSQQPSEIRSVAFAPDGKYLAVACMDATIRLWDRATLTERIVIGHSGAVWSVQFAADGKTLVSAAADTTVRLWNADGAPRFVFKGHTDLVRRAVFMPDSRTIVSAGADRLLKFWDAQRNLDYSSWAGHAQPAKHLAFTPDGSVLATGAEDGSVMLWEPATGRRLAALPSHRQPIQGLAFAPDGNHLAVASRDPFVYIYDRKTGKEVARLAGHTLDVTAVAFSLDGKRLASGGVDGSVRIWDWQTRKTMAVCIGHKWGIRGLAFSPDGKLLASGSDDRTIKLWETATGQLRPTPPMGHEKIVWGLAFSPDSRTLASGGDDKTVRLWDVETGRSTMVLRGHAGPVHSLAFSPDGRTLATTSNEMKLWQTATGCELAAFTDPGNVWSVAWAPRGLVLVGGCSDGSLVRWDANAHE